MDPFDPMEPGVGVEAGVWVGDGVADSSGVGDGFGVDVGVGSGVGVGDSIGVGVGDGAGVGVGVQFQNMVAGLTGCPFSVPLKVTCSAEQGKPEIVTCTGLFKNTVPLDGFTKIREEEAFALQNMPPKGGICDALRVTLQDHAEP